MNTLVNREFELPEDGYYQLVPLGDHRLRLSRKTDATLVGMLEAMGIDLANSDRVSVIQVCDAQSITAMADAFNAIAADPDFAGVLVDRDHFSDDIAHTTEAAGWLMNLQARPDGLYGFVRWVDPTDISTGRYRFFSPVFSHRDVQPLGGNRVRPLRLARGALTNRPNMRTIKPLSNREDGTTQEESLMDYKTELCNTLGLPPEATDEEITAAIAALKAPPAEEDPAPEPEPDPEPNPEPDPDALAEMENRAKAAETRVAELEREQLERQVDQDLTEFADVIANREEARAQLLANREGTRKLMGALKAKASVPAEPLRNRETATHPDHNEEEETLVNRRREQTELVTKVMAERKLRNRAAALEFAMEEKPELFR